MYHEKNDWTELTVYIASSLILCLVIWFLDIYTFDFDKAKAIMSKQSTTLSCFNRETEKREIIKSEGGFFYHKFDKRNYYIEDGELKSISVVLCNKMG